MKKVFLLVFVGVLVLSVTSAFATIANTKHNLTSTGGQYTHTTDATATLCGFCHIPHGGNTAVGGLPIWARQTPSGPYTVYGNGTTLSGTPISNPPGTFSLTCLSCHDGSIGIGVISKNGVTSTFAMTGRVVNAGGRMANVTDNNGYNPYIGTDLTNDHPVGFTFPSAGYTPNGGVPGIGIVINTTAPNHLTGANSNTTYPLYAEVSANQFECSTCHDPHLEDGVRGGGAASKFLRSANAGICQDCHNTK